MVQKVEEKWWQSRRMWAAIVGTALLGIQFFVPMEYKHGTIQLLIYVAEIFGIGLPAWSWLKPKN